MPLPSFSTIRGLLGVPAVAARFLWEICGFFAELRFRQAYKLESVQIN